MLLMNFLGVTCDMAGDGATTPLPFSFIYDPSIPADLKIMMNDLGGWPSIQTAIEAGHQWYFLNPPFAEATAMAISNEMHTHLSHIGGTFSLMPSTIGGNLVANYTPLVTFFFY